MPDNRYIDQHLFEPIYSNDDNLSKTGIPTRSFFILLIPDSQRQNIIPIKSFQHLFQVYPYSTKGMGTRKATLLKGKQF